MGEPQAIRDARAAYKVETDVLADFLDLACDRLPAMSCPAGDLYKAYCGFVEDNGLGKPISGRAFGDALRERGHESQRRGGRIYRVGLQLTDAGRDYLAGSAPAAVKMRAVA